MNHEELKILLSAYFDGEVSSEEKELVENHLLECKECQKEYAEYKKISSSLKRWPQERLSPDVQLNIKAKFKEESMKKAENKIQWDVVVGVIGVMFVVLFVSVSVQSYMKRGLQARVRSATDDLGDPYSPGQTKYISIAKAERQDASRYLTTATSTLGTTAQYEPYYLRSNYSKSEERNQLAQRKNVSVDISDSVSSSQTSIGDVYEYEANKDFKKTDKGERLEVVKAKESPQVNQLANSVRGRSADGLQLSSNLGITDSNVAPAALKSIQFEFYGGSSLPAEKGAYRDEDEGMVYDHDERLYYPVPPSNSESYEAINENHFLNAMHVPLSTFSIDVDTASYSNVRRFLNQGQLPPVDSVRIEELINYFGYDYPEPMWGQPFSITTEVASCPWNPSHQLALIGLQGKRLSGMSMPASNLVFLIDVSGSMNQPNKLPLLQDAFRMLTQELEGKDKVSLVVYAGAAGLVLEATPGNYKERILSAIDRLSAGGSTAGGDGIRLAYQVARDNFINGGNNRVILATDGDFNVGISNDNDLVRLIENHRDQGIFLTVLGFGVGNYKDSKMEKLADHGNGNYFYIDNQSEARKVLVNELGSTLFTIAKDVKLQVEFNPATVREYRLIGYENRTLAKEDFNDDTKDAGELGAGHSVTALYEIIPMQMDRREYGVDPLLYQKSPEILRGRSSDIMTVKLRYKEPKGTTSKFIKKVVSQKDYQPVIKSDNLRFASAVAEFGLLLRNSPYRAGSSFEHVLQQIYASKTDEYGYRSEFTQLVRKAQSLAPYPVPLPIAEPWEYQPYPDSRSNTKKQK